MNNNELQNIYTIGYQYLIEVEDKKPIKVDGIIVSDSNSHQIRSGIVLKIGDMALKENPIIGVGDRIYLHEIDLKYINITSIGKSLGVVQSNTIKAVEKLS